MDRRPWYVRTPDWWRAPGAPLPTAPGRVGALLLVLLLAAAGVLLRQAFGWPPTWPDGGVLAAAMHGGELSPPLVRPALGLASWAAWLWLVGTLALQVLLAVAEALTRGARWVAALRGVVNRVTPPVLRRVAYQAVVGATVLQLAGRVAPTVAAAPAPAHAAAIVADAHRPAAAAVAGQPAWARGAVYHTVGAGDTLRTLSERYYGRMDAWMKIRDANVGRVMTDGEIFSAAPTIKAGWVLTIPEPTLQAGAPAAGRAGAPAGAPTNAPWLVYTVEDGDDLRGIAQRYYGNEMQWPRIFDANRGARLPDGRTLTNPDLIWPGLRLAIPGVPAPAAAATPGPTAVKAAVPAVAPPALAPPPAPARMPTTSPTPAVRRASPPHYPNPQAEHRIAAGDAARAPAPTITPAAIATPRPPVAPAAPAPEVRRAPVGHGGSGLPRELPALAAVAAAVAVGARRWWLAARARRGEDGRTAVTDPGVAMLDTYAEADVVRPLAHQLQGGDREPAVELVEDLDGFLQERGLVEATVLAVEQPRRGGPAVLVRMGLAARATLLGVTDALADRLGAELTIAVDGEHDVRVALARSRRLRLLRPAALPVVPFGVRPHGQVLYGNLAALGHVLVAGRTETSIGRVLTSLVCGLAARCGPDELEFRTIGDGRRLPSGLAALPHQVRRPVAPDDATAVAALLGELSREVERRIAAPAERGPRLVLVVGELADLPEAAATALALLLRHGPARGVHVLAGTARVDRLDAHALDRIETRLVFDLQDDVANARLVGDPVFATGLAGRMAVCLAGRPPVNAYAYWVTDEHLGELVALLAEAYGDRPPAEGAVPPVAAAVTAGPAPTTDVVPEATVSPSAPAREEASSEEATPAAAAPALALVSSAPPAVQVHCFGRFRLEVGGQEVASGPAALQQNARSLLAYLVVERNGVSRDRLVEAYWPDLDVDVATNRLRQTLFQLRGNLRRHLPELPPGTVELKGGWCALDPALVWSDVRAFDVCRERAARRDVAPEEARQLLEQAMAVYQGPLLAQAECPWLEPALVAEYAERCFEVADALAQWSLRRGDVEGAAARYGRVLALHPTHERAARRLYACYGRLGDRVRLMRAHRELGAAIDREDPDAGPEEQTQQAYERALQAMDALTGSASAGPQAAGNEQRAPAGAADPVAGV